MKKVASILAVTALTLGMFSCEPESSVQQTENLYSSLKDNVTASTDTDKDVRKTDRRTKDDL